MSNHKNISKGVLITTFFVLLILPSIIMLFNFENNKNLVKKKQNANKVNTMYTKIKDLKNNYQDSFGLKKTLVNSYADFKINYLNEDPFPNSVVTGKDGWYFLGNKYNFALNNSFGNHHFSKKELLSITQNLNHILTYLNSKNIKFYLVIPPNKSSIYTEKLPYQLEKKKTKLNLLNTHLQNELQFNIIDLNHSLKNKKDSTLLYLKTDTHWNDYGAYLGYYQTMETLVENFNINISPLISYSFKTKNFNEGDITRMINVKINESAIYLNKTVKSKVKTISDDSYNYKHYLNLDGNLKLMMYCDSFASSWFNFFKESFEESIFIRNNYQLNQLLIDEKKPDVIIFEIIERNISLLTKKEGFLF